MNECMMGCDPPEGGGEEKFYVLVMEEMTIYGHTVDAWTQARYPSDWPATVEGRKQGIEFGCWHSVACPEGELGSQGATTREITYEEFVAARDASWPEKPDEPITQEGPIAAIAAVGPDGKMREVWNSLEGDDPTRADEVLDPRREANA